VRKKLADRLAKRGIALSIAALAAAISESRLAAVPIDLMEAVVERVVGGAIPVTVAELAREGAWAMRVKLMLIAAAGAMAAGWAALAGPIDPPKPVDPPPKAEAKPAAEKPAEKAVEFTDRPRMLKAVDMRIFEIREAVWSPDGKQIAVQGQMKQNPQDALIFNSVAVFDAADPTRFQTTGELPSDAVLVGFATSGSELVTALHEYRLISGRHEVSIWTRHAREPREKGPLWATSRVVPLDADGSSHLRLTQDGKSFRTVARDQVESGEGNWQEVREIDAASGRTTKTFPLLKMGMGWHAFDLSPDGRLLAAIDVNFGIHMQDVENGGRKWVKPPLGPPEPGSPFSLSFSADGRRLSVGGGGDIARVYDAATGDQLLAVENKGETTFGASATTFSGDGRLVAWVGHERTQRYPLGVAGFRVGTPTAPTYRNVIQVWDVERKKLLKSWNGRAEIAFAPDRPVLAIFESKGDAQGTRLGFWDFAAAK
jgi:WD40 repeat protein